MNRASFEEDHSDFEVRGEVIDLFGHRAGTFRNGKVFNQAGKLVASVQDHYLFDQSGGKIADLRKIRMRMPDLIIDTAAAALWLLSKQE